MFLVLEFQCCLWICAEEGSKTGSSHGKDKSGKTPKGGAARSFTFRELAAATRGFKQVNLIGEGGFGRVYKGRLETGQASYPFLTCLFPSSPSYNGPSHLYFSCFSVWQMFWAFQCAICHCGTCSFFFFWVFHFGCFFFYLQLVAVKQLNHDGQQGFQEFIVEVLMLSLLHHANLVTLFGYCTDGDQRLLVYEYMPMGSLEDHLFGSFLTFLLL